MREEVVQLKNGTKVRYTAIKMIYVASIRTLHNEFSSKHVLVSSTTFFNFKPFYCIVPSEKGKQSFVCINCQNPHLLLQAVNRYRTSKNLIPHESLTKYLEKLKANEQFDELTEAHTTGISVLKNLTQRKMEHPFNTKELLALITKN